MARARNIKPSIYTNEDLAELPIAARWLFVGLWTMADREGRLEDRPKRIKMTIFPADAVDVEDLLSALAEAGQIIRYQAEGNAYIWIPGFARHQKPHPREAPSTIPPYLGNAEATPRYDQGMAKDTASPAESLFSESPISDCSSPKRRARPGEKWGECPETVDQQAWNEWTNYKAGAPKAATITKLSNLLSRYPPEIQRKAVDHSIANGYDGVFPEKFHEADQRSLARPGRGETVDEKLRRLRGAGKPAVGEPDGGVRGQVLEGVWERAER